jgi:two-component system, NtrC family, sensor histidine kinase HydH
MARRKQGGFLQIQKTIKRDLFVLSVCIAGIALILVLLLLQLSREGASSQIAQSIRQVSLSCELMVAGVTRVNLSVDAHPRKNQPLSPSMAGAVIDLALHDQAGVEGGFWQPSKGVFAYAFPTYDGSGIKRDVPSAELDRIKATSQRAHDAASLVSDVRPGLREAVVFAACPVTHDPVALVAWTLKRVPLMSTALIDKLLYLTSLLLAFVLISGIWLRRMLSRWCNQSEELTAQLSHAERLATLGRLAAGMAHEIRNPIGTMRLKAENALAAPPDVREMRVLGALQAVLSQTERLDSLVSSLLALSQPFQIDRRHIDLRAWLEERCVAFQEVAYKNNVEIKVVIDAASFPNGYGTSAMDPTQMARALDNLLLNALAYCPSGGTVEIGAHQIRHDRFGLWVADNGAGVPIDLQDKLFDPFVSNRPGGTGLGLALVREIVHAHGGHIALASTSLGARFEMELPWRASLL